MGAISPLGIDALDVPAELDSASSPFGVFQVAGTGGLLLESLSIEEEELIGTAIRADVLSVSTPVKRHDVRRVLGEGSEERPVSSRVDVDSVVVGADSQLRLVRGKRHALDPLISVIECPGGLCGTNTVPDVDAAIIGRNDETTIFLVDDGTGALRGSHVRESGGTASLALTLLVGDDNAAGLATLAGVPDNDLVVVT